MPVIAIFSSPYSRGNEVADLVAAELGISRAEQDIYLVAAAQLGTDVAHLLANLQHSSRPGSRAAKEDMLRLATIRLALAEAIQSDQRLLHGFLLHLIPRNIGHVLRVGAVANRDYRLAAAMAMDQISEKKASTVLHHADKTIEPFLRGLVGRDPYEPALYDLMLPLNETSLDEAASSILVSASSAALQPTEDSQQAARDFLLAAHVWLRLAEEGHDVSVKASEGAVTVSINQFVRRLEPLQQKLAELAMTVDGVTSARAIPGDGFVPPSLLPTLDLPPRVLLVDDEREFVHSLSERLQTRQLPSTVVYDGEAALESVADDTPEVMVLDLKMPGIGGMDVLRQVKRDHPEIEVIILTGHGSARENELAMELGAFAYLTKPVNIEVLAATMRDAYQKVAQAQSGNDE